MAVSSTNIHVIIKLFLGGINYLFCKFSLDLLKVDDQKRIGLMTLSNFMSLFLVGLPIYANELSTAKAASRKIGAAPYITSTWSDHGLAILPGFLEFVAVFLSMYANSYLPATIMVFMKATRVLWSALMSKYWLGRKLYGYHWFGVLLTFIGLVPIIYVQQATGDKKKGTGDNKAVFAFIAVALCEVFRAIRVTLEERLMKERNQSCAFVQYVEGYAGVILSIVLLVYRHCMDLEDSTRTLDIIAESKLGCLMLICHTIAHGVTNYSSNYVTKVLSSVHNAIISEMRIMVVWGPEFLIYLLTVNRLAKPLGKEWNILNLIDIPGFIIIASSAFIYSGILRVPCMPSLYPKEVTESVKDIENVETLTATCSEGSFSH